LQTTIRLAPAECRVVLFRQPERLKTLQWQLLIHDLWIFIRTTPDCLPVRGQLQSRDIPCRTLPVAF
jgi:hypothetical protein